MIWKLLIAIAALIIIIALAICVGLFTFTILRRPHRPWEALPESDPNYKYRKMTLDGIKWIKEKAPEKWELTSFDGLKLRGFYLPAENNPDKKVVLAMHGYRSHDFADFAVYAKFLHEAGYDVLMPDQRCHGESEGRYICFGVRERYDCRDWAKLIVEKLGEDCSIHLLGVSMGCATVTMALGLDLPEQVKGCVSDCGYTSPRDEFVHVMKRDYHLPEFPFIGAMKLLCKLIAGFDIDVSTIDVLEKNELPVLFIHGGKDDFVPTYMSHKNFLAAKAEGKDILIIQGAAHAQCPLKEPDKCREKVLSFLRQ